MSLSDEQFRNGGTERLKTASFSGFCFSNGNHGRKTLFPFAVFSTASFQA
jgi:hypothetical protein